jgi:hypothetical protein
MKIDFDRAPASTEEVLKIISRSETGRKLLERFLPLFNRGKVQISHYSPAVVAQMREHLGEDQPVGACFMIDGEQGVIFIDPSSPLGVLAPFLVHEITHCLNADLWASQRRVLDRRQRDQLMLEVETQAFETQHVFINELKARFPEYEAFLKAYSPKAKILVDRLTSTDIADLYGFKVG